MAAAQAAPGRLKREPEAAQGVGAQGAGVIYLFGFNKSGRSTQGRGERTGQPRFLAPSLSFWDL